MNDAQTFAQLPAIGPGIELDFPGDFWLLGDKIYPCRYPVLTQFRSNQIAARPPEERDGMRHFNELVQVNRAYVEHAIVHFFVTQDACFPRW